MNIEDIASQSSVVFSIGLQHDWRDPISGVHVSPGSAETLVRRGGIANHLSLEYSLSNISATNYENRLMCVEVLKFEVEISILLCIVYMNCMVFTGM